MSSPTDFTAPRPAGRIPRGRPTGCSFRDARNAGTEPGRMTRLFSFRGPQRSKGMRKTINRLVTAAAIAAVAGCGDSNVGPEDVVGQYVATTFTIVING